MRSKSCHHLFSCGNRGVNVRFGVGGGEESGLEGAGGEVHALGQHAVEILFEPLKIGLHGLG